MPISAYERLKAEHEMTLQELEEARRELCFYRQCYDALLEEYKELERMSRKDGKAVPIIGEVE